MNYITILNIFHCFSSRVKRAKADTHLTLKMFFILGLTWIFDIIAFAIEKHQMTTTQNTQIESVSMEIVLVIFLVINASHGVIFFCIIYFTSANIKKIKIWCGLSRARTAFSNYYSSLRHTSTANRTRATSIQMDTFSKATQKSFLQSSRMRSTRANHERDL